MRVSGDRATLRVRRLVHGEGLPLWAYQTRGAAGLDLYAAQALILAPSRWALVPTGFAMELPPGTVGDIRARSGRALREGLTVLQGVGTVDEDYRGEVQVLLINLGPEPVRIERGDRIAQLVVLPVVRVEITEVETLSDSDRHAEGFGSTGQR